MTTKFTIPAWGQFQLAWLVFLVGMVLTGVAWRTVSAWEEEKARHEFLIHAKDTLGAVQQRLEVYANILYGARGLFAASDEVTRDEWRRYTAIAALGGHHPGIHSLAFIRYVSAPEKARFEKRVRSDASANGAGYPNFGIFPPGERSDYFPIEYIEPEASHSNLLGVDRGTEPDVRKVLERARDSGQPVSSGRLHGSAESRETSHFFLMALPIYRNGSNPASVMERRAALVGFVAARVELAALLKDVVGAGVLEELFFELYDGGSGAAKMPQMASENLLYTTNGGNLLYAGAATATRFTHRAELKVFERDWLFFCGSRPGGAAVGGYLPIVVLLGGMVTSALLFALVLMLVTQRRRVMDEIVRQQSLFSQVMDALPVNVFLKDQDFRFVLINEESARTLGINKEAAVGKTNFDVFPHEVAARLLEYDEQVFAVDRLVTREERLVINGQARTLLAGKKIIRLPGSSEPMLLGFSFDIGDRKKVELELEQEQRFIRQVIDSIPSIVFVKDAGGTVLLINQAGAAYFGMTPEQFVGRNQTELFPQREEIEEIAHVDHLVIDERQNVDLEESLTLQNGQVVWLSMVKRPLPQPDGRVHVLGVASDITERKQAEALAQRFGSLLQSSFNEIYLFDANSLNFLETSEGARKNLGYSVDELSHMTPLDIKPSFTPSSFERLVAPLRNGEQAWLLFDTFHRRKDGTTYPVEVRLQFMDANPPVFLAIILDVTERLRLEQETARARANELSRSLADAVGEGLIGVDLSHQVVFANPKAQEVLGFSEEEMRGKKLDDVVQAATAGGNTLTDATCPAWGMISEGRVFQTDDWLFRRSDGSRFPVSLVIAPMFDNEKTAGAVLSFQDITTRRASEEALTHHMVELARLNAELDEFTYAASHDLQEPVRKLVAFSDWLRKDLGDGLPPRAEQDLGFIVDAAQRMQRLVEDLLALSRTGNVSMVRENVALDDAVERALEALELRIAESGATISRVPLPSVSGDSTLLSQLYQNLIGNALKFVADQRPEISLTAEQIDGVWVFGVRDNGIGIGTQYMDQIFQPFKRLHGLGQYQGSGVGLTICRKVVERHGGRIWVESEEGKGAHFKFTLREPGV